MADTPTTTLTAEDTRLFSRIYGGLVGGAIGDAMGGPVEGLDYHEIERLFGRVEELLPYRKPPAEHAQFTNHPGSVTDDTRMSLLHCRALLDADGEPTRGDLARTFVDYYHRHEGRLERAFVEEYYLASIYGERKLIYGGQPTNGAIMGNAPLGLVHPADPEAAFAVAFELAFITDGYAKESSAIGAAAVAAAMRPGATVTSLIDDALAAARRFRREGPLWTETMTTFAWARFEGFTNQDLIGVAVAAAEEHRDVFAIRETLYPRLAVSPLGSEAAQTLAVALGMLTAAEGDFATAVIGAVNYGRDNDSYAAVAGAIAGALGGVEAIPSGWVDTVREANPDADLPGLARALTDLVVRRHRARQGVVEAVEGLIAS